MTTFHPPYIRVGCVLAPNNSAIPWVCIYPCQGDTFLRIIKLYNFIISCHPGWLVTSAFTSLLDFQGLFVCPFGATIETQRFNNPNHRGGPTLVFLETIFNDRLMEILCSKVGCLLWSYTTYFFYQYVLYPPKVTFLMYWRARQWDSCLCFSWRKYKF